MENKLINFICLLFFLCVLFQERIIAQELPARADQAELLFKAKQYARASQFYQTLLKERSSKKYKLHLAFCYLQMRKFEDAQVIYEEVSESGTMDPEDEFRYGDALMQNGLYAKALSAFEEYASLSQANRAIVKIRIQACELAGKSNTNTSFRIQNEAELNTRYSDFGIQNMGDYLLFASDRVLDSAVLKKQENERKIYGWTGVPYLKVYRTRKLETGHFEKPIPEEQINSEFHTGPVALSKDKRRIYFTETRMVKKPGMFYVDAAAPEYLNRLEIYYRDFVKGHWSEAKAFPYNQSLKYSVGHPALSADGKKLYFASDMPGGLGGSDLYYSEIRNTGFSAPVNLGPSVNTAGNEVFPFASADGTLYFSSDGRVGFGGLDIFKIRLNEQKQGIAENLGLPVNSPRDDFSFSFVDSTGSKGYFSSDRTKGLGEDDIYSFSYRRRPVLLVNVIHAETMEPYAGASVDLRSMFDNGPGLLISDGKGRAFFLTDTNQNYRIKAFHKSLIDSACLDLRVLKNSPDTMQVVMALSKDEEKIIAVKKGTAIPKAVPAEEEDTDDKISPGLKTANLKPARKPQKSGKAAIPADKSDDQNDLTENEAMTKETLVKGKTFILKNFYYDLDKWNIRPDAAKQLDKLYQILLENPMVNIELSSHTDSRGSDAYNNLLSQLRADAAVRYLSDKGISTPRLRSRGYGKTRIMNKCKNNVPCTEAEHQQNRRTEVTVTD